jgi:hypothetical protein
VAQRIEVEIMKLLVVGPDIWDRSRVKNFTGVYAYYLARELRERGVELKFIDGKNPKPLTYFGEIDAEGADHVLALGLRYFTHVPIGCASILKTKVTGAVTQLHDGLVHDYLAAHMRGVDCTFMFRDDQLRTRDWQRFAKNNHHIGWAADRQLLYPAKEAGELRIVIDHPYYKDGQPDFTATITQDALAFTYTSRWRNRYDRVRLRRLVNGGAEDVTVENSASKPFDRRHVSFEEIAAEYRRTHVYFVTHKESVGLTCLEMGLCGALVVAPKGFIYPDRLQTVRHVEYEGAVPWDLVMSRIDVSAAAALAQKQTWARVADRMLKWFEKYK